MDLLFLFTGLLLGIVIGWVIKMLIGKGENTRVEERNKFLQEDNIKIESELNEEREKVLQLNSNLSSLQSNYDNLQEKLVEQKEEVELFNY